MKQAVNSELTLVPDYKAGKSVFQSLTSRYDYTNGKIYQSDCTDFLKSIETGTVTTVFADPPYNIGKAEWDDLGDQDEYIRWSLEWIKEVSRILRPNGTFYICGFTEILADLRRPAMDYFKKCKWLIWYYDNKANMRNDWGRSHESIICFRTGRNGGEEFCCWKPARKNRPRRNTGRR